VQNDRRNYIVVGAFVIAMAIALIVWVMQMSGPGGPTDRYFVIYRSVMGLESGAEIQFEGFPVGTIQGITPIHGDDGRSSFRVDLDVKRGWPIPVGSQATIATGLFEASVINIEQAPGSTGAGRIEPGSEIPAREAADLFAVAGETADKVGGILDELATRAPAILDNAEAVTQDLRQATSQINELLDSENVGRVDRILANVDGASGELNGLLADVQAAGANLNQLMERLDRVLEEESGDVSQTLDDLRHTTAALASHIDAITANLEDAIRNANEFSQQIREDPSVLLRGREVEE
jgi:phospholipid/cholesterol/gamma-HCH transport system substrate-binding protein